MRPRLLAASACLLALVLVSQAILSAQEKDKGRKFALVVGVNEYDGDFPELAYAVNDADKLAGVLRSKACGFEVTLLTDKTDKKPTAANIRAALEAVLKGRTKHDTVLVALAGHGVQLEVSDPKGDGEPRKFTFFCSRDADLSAVKYASGHADSMINLDTLFETLGRSNPGVKLVMMDACRDAVKTTGRKRKLSEDRVTVPDGVQALLSCGKGQVSYEMDTLKHGLFFHHVIEGLQGKARNGDGEVTWASLTDHVTRGVEKAAKGFGKKQTPAAAGYYEGGAPMLAMKSDAKEEKTPERPKVDDKLVTNSIGMKLARIPAGEFMMGSPEGEKDRGKDEKLHKVRITKDFSLGIHHVTQEQFKKVMGYNPSFFSKDGTKRDKDAMYYDSSLPGGGNDAVDGIDTDDFPVENVSWQEAVEFCEKLSALAEEKREKRLYRLPTEAEWEYSCRGGPVKYSAFHFGNTLNGTDANCDGTSPYGTDEKGPFLKRTSKVGSYKKPNAFGLHDMHGNVSQWCSDWYSQKYYDGSPRDDPQGPEKVSYQVRVLRGGGWYGRGRDCRSADRGKRMPTYRFQGIGFRVALSLAP